MLAMKTGCERCAAPPRRRRRRRDPLVTRRLAAMVVVLVAATGLPASPASAVATSVTASVSATSVVAGKSVTIGGSVSGPVGRGVVLQLWTRAGWRKVASDTTDSGRRYLMKVPTSWYDRHDLRVVAPAAGTADRGVSPTRRVVVKPSYTPVGSASDWRSLGGSRARWNPCQAITWKFNQNGGYDGSLADLKGAFFRIHRATGLRFVYEGTTSYVAFQGDDPSVDITVSFVSSLAGTTAGEGGSDYAWSGDSPKEFVRGRLRLDRSESLRHGFDTSGSVTWGQVMQHEIGHVVGLDHASGTGQLMYPAVSSTNHRMGAGDLAGFNWVGLRGGCIANSLR